MDDLEKRVRSGEKPRVQVHLDHQYDKTYVLESNELRAKYDGHKGRVISAHTGHGLCFKVHFPMGGEAYYDTEELTCL